MKHFFFCCLVLVELDFESVQEGARLNHCTLSGELG